MTNRYQDCPYRDQPVPRLPNSITAQNQHCPIPKSSIARTAQYHDYPVPRPPSLTAVNGIIHDEEVVGGGARILTVLVSSGGSYKTGRLYLTPDSGAFSRVTVLALHTPHLQLGGRYIMMGQIYRRGMQLAPAVLRVVSGRLRAGDGLVTSGSSFTRRFNRRKDGRGLRAALSRCT
ncbi:unnamed protein product [Ranitomeya imitator]|uniref:Dirigent protein n=1 Tax=Ranitomeya imitator TaxID=111125 RepID=A0ABN9M186_9NEOB|nr:unnamed protein product [Ranitomeya imitator]